MDPNLEIPGGVQEHARGLHDALTKLGQEVVIVACGQRGEEDKERKVVSLGSYSEVRLPRIPVIFDLIGRPALIPLTWQTPGKIKQFLEKEKFDILQFEGPAGLFNSEVLALSKTTSVLTFHVFPGALDVFWLALPALPLLRCLNRKFGGRIAVSAVAADYAQKYYPGKYQIIPNGVDVSRFSPQGRKLEKFIDNKVNLLFLGRFDPRKGILELLQAYQQLTKKFANLRLIVVGDGPQRKQAEEFIKENQLKEVEFLGRVPAEMVPVCYRTADIYCSPALYGESFGIVLIEAMASGVPVVAYANEGYRLVLKDKPFSDFLVKPGDIDGLARALGRLIKDADLRKKLGKEGLKEIKQYSWEAVGQRTLDFYKSVLS